MTAGSWSWGSAACLAWMDPAGGSTMSDCKRWCPHGLAGSDEWFLHCASQCLEHHHAIQLWSWVDWSLERWLGGSWRAHYLFPCCGMCQICRPCCPLRLDFAETLHERREFHYFSPYTEHSMRSFADLSLQSQTSNAWCWITHESSRRLHPCHILSFLAWCCSRIDLLDSTLYSRFLWAHIHSWNLKMDRYQSVTLIGLSSLVYLGNICCCRPLLEKKTRHFLHSFSYFQPNSACHVPRSDWSLTETECLKYCHISWSWKDWSSMREYSGKLSCHMGPDCILAGYTTAQAGSHGQSFRRHLCPSNSAFASPYCPKTWKSWSSNSSHAPASSQLYQSCSTCSVYCPHIVANTATGDGACWDGLSLVVHVAADTELEVCQHLQTNASGPPQITSVMTSAWWS